MCVRISSPSVNNLYDSLQVKPKEKQVETKPSEVVIQQPIKDKRVESDAKEGKVSGAGIEFVDQKQPDVSSVGNHSAKRTSGVIYKAISEKAVSSTSNTLIKGVSVGIPFTNKSIGFGVQHEVSKALQETFESISKEKVKTGTGTIISTTKDLSKTVTDQTLENLLRNSDVGKGVSTLTMKEASKESGGVIKAVTNSYKELKSDFSAMKAAQNVSQDALPKLAKSTVNSTIKKETAEAAIKLAKDPYLAFGILGDFGEKTFSKLVEKEVTKIASQKGLTISKEAMKSFISEASMPIITKKVDLMYDAGIHLGGSKKLTKKTFDSITKELGQFSAQEATKTAQKIVDNAISKASAATMLGVSKEVATGAGEKILKKGVSEGIESGVQKAIKRAGSEISEKLVSQSGERLIKQSILYGAHDGIYGALVKPKMNTIVGTGIAKYGTAVGHVANGAILAYDGYDAYKKIKDPNVSMTSKALATTTVGLDIAAMALDKKYKPLSWVASGLGIATSIGSDLTKDKN